MLELFDLLASTALAAGAASRREQEEREERWRKERIDAEIAQEAAKERLRALEAREAAVKARERELALQAPTVSAAPAKAEVVQSPRPVLWRRISAFIRGAAKTINEFVKRPNGQREAE